MSVYATIVCKYSCIINSSARPPLWDVDYEALALPAKVSFEQGQIIQHSTCPSVHFNLYFEFNATISWYFTDGSKIPDDPYAGFAIYHANSNSTYKKCTSKHTSIYSCEAMAILLALELAINDDYTHIQIFSDSQSVLKAIQSPLYWKIKSYLILEIRQKIYSLSKNGKKVELFWVPAHVGIRYNEMVDLAAKDNIKSGIDTQMLIPKDDFKAMWKQDMFSELHEWCKNVGLSLINPKGAKYCKLFLNTVSRKPWFDKLPIHRKAIVSLNRLRINYTSLGESLFRKDIIDSPFCSCGLIEQTAEHIFWDCPDYIEPRYDMIQKLNVLNLAKPYNLDNLLNNLDLNICDILFCFISAIDLKI